VLLRKKRAILQQAVAVDMIEIVNDHIFITSFIMACTTFLAFLEDT
jgi:hypothetical protein